MSIEPIQDLVRIKLELDGYFVRSNVRFKVGGSTPKGKTAAYSDLDVVAVKIDPRTGNVTDRIWAEIKAHLTSSLTPGYLRGFLSDYAVMLDIARLDALAKSKDKWQARKDAAHETATALLGAGFRRRLFFAGRKPNDGGVGAAAMLDSDLEVVYVRDLASDLVASLGHQEGSEPLVRVINMLKEYGIAT